METPYQRALRKYGDSFEMIKKMAEHGGSINDKLKPLQFLGCGDVGFVFRGT